MKTIRVGIILFLLSFCHFTTFGQTEIFGHWKAGCYLERNGDGSLTACSICPTSLKNNQLELSEFELEINNLTIKITMDGKSTSTTYKWDGKLEIISFEYEKTKFSFKVLRGSSDKKIILKENKCGGVLLLTKI